jgi:hypothetical protein
VDLHHDRGARVNQHARSGRRVVRRVTRNPRADPRRGTQPVVRGRVRRRVRLGQPGSTEARPTVPARRLIQPPCVGRVLSCGLEEDHVVHDARLLRLDHRARDVLVLRQVWLEQETVVVVEPAHGRPREVRPHGRERHRLPGCSRGSAHRLDGPPATDACTATDPACDEVLLGRSQDPPRLTEVRWRIRPRHPRRHSSELGHHEDAVRVGGGSSSATQ